jgi:hypothetical protein
MPETEGGIGAIVSRFPGPVTLYPSRKKWFLVLLASAVFTAGGVAMVSSNESLGWLVLVFFGTGLVMSATMLLPGAGGLVLDADGFQVTTMFRSRRSRWRDVTNFEPISVPYSRQRMVGFDDATAGRTITAINKALAGHNAALPDNYGFSVDELAELMRRWRERAAGS